MTKLLQAQHTHTSMHTQCYKLQLQHTDIVLQAEHTYRIQTANTHTPTHQIFWGCVSIGEKGEKSFLAAEEQLMFRLLALLAAVGLMTYSILSRSVFVLTKSYTKFKK